MAANFGKFIDRSPLICAAGMSSGDLDLDLDDEHRHYMCDDKFKSLEENTSEDEDNIKYTHDENLQTEDALEYPEPARFTCNENIQTEDDFVPPEMIRYISFQESPIQIGILESPTYKEECEEIMTHPHETSSKSYAHREDDDSVRDLMNPPKTPYQVLWDSQVGHEMYRTTHDDYNAPKKITDGYLKVESVHSEPDKCLKAAGKRNANGFWVKCTCDWHKKEAVERSNEIEDDYVTRHKSQLGKALSPNQNIDSVPKGHRFGNHSYQESYGMEELLKDSGCPPCVFRRDFYVWIAALNKCRNALKDRDFDFKEFYARTAKHDTERTGFLPIDEFYDICAQEHITFHKEEIELLLNLLKITVDDKINYGRFIEIIDVNKPAIDIVPFHDLPKEYQYYVTSNQAASNYLIRSETELAPAGKPSTHDDLAEHHAAHSHFHNLGEESLGSPLNFEKN